MDHKGMDLKGKIDIFEDYPIDGISFKDINSLIADGEAFQYVVNRFYDIAKTMDANLVGIPESRGYIFGSPLAYKLGLGLVPIRKPNKLPGEVLSRTYDLEYGTNTVEIQSKAVNPGDRVILIDDLLATGGTIHAAAKLVEELGGEVVGMLFLIELTGLKGREHLKEYEVASLVTYEY
jgi:adenine phosphoribosyltransferase